MSCRRTETNLKSQVMEEDKKKQVLGNGLATESESPVVAKVQILNYKPLRFFIIIGTGDPEDVARDIYFLLSLRTPRTALV